MINKQKFASPYQLIDGERPLSKVLEVVSYLVDKTLYFDDTTFSVSSSLFKV